MIHSVIIAQNHQPLSPVILEPVLPQPDQVIRRKEALISRILLVGWLIHCMSGNLWRWNSNSSSYVHEFSRSSSE